MMDIILIISIGLLIWVAIMVGTYPILRRTNNFISFLYIWTLAIVVYPLLLVWLLD